MSDSREISAFAAYSVKGSGSVTVVSAGAELVENNDWALAGADRRKASSAVSTKILMKCIVEPPLINLCLELNVT